MSEIKVKETISKDGPLFPFNARLPVPTPST